MEIAGGLVIVVGYLIGGAEVGGGEELALRQRGREGRGGDGSAPLGYIPRGLDEGRD